MGKARMKLWKQTNLYTFNLNSCLQCGQLGDERLHDPDRVGLLQLRTCHAVPRNVYVCVYVYLWIGMKEGKHVCKLYDK